MINYSYIKNPRSRLLIDNLKLLIYKELSVDDIEAWNKHNNLHYAPWMYDHHLDKIKDTLFYRIIGLEDNHIENFINEWRLKKV